MPEPTTPQLSESDVERIAARKANSYGSMVNLPVAERDALIRDWRALSEQVAKFSELADKRHDELCEARRQRDSLAADMATHIRDATAALREQLAEAEKQTALTAAIDFLEQRRRSLGQESIPEYARTINFLQAILNEDKKEYPPLRVTEIRL